MAIAFVAASPLPAVGGGWESEFVRLVNAARSSRGLRPLTVRSDLVRVAERHSARMAAAGDIWHNSRLASEVRDWILVGENVGVGKDVDELHEAFMGSSSHRENILERRFHEGGVGVVASGGRLYVTEIFVQRGARRAVAPSAPAAVARHGPRPAPKPRPPAVPARTVSMLQRLRAIDPGVGGSGLPPSGDSAAAVRRVSEKRRTPDAGRAPDVVPMLLLAAVAIRLGIGGRAAPFAFPGGGPMTFTFRASPDRRVRRSLRLIELQASTRIRPNVGARTVRLTLPSAPAPARAIRG